jgi:prepilin peptidase CpaA
MISLVWLAFVGLAGFVAVSDVTRYRIPNWVSLALIVLFAGVLLWRHADAPWPWHVAAFALVLLVGLMFFAFRQVGAGDAKFFAAIALWAGFGALVPLLFWTGVAGLMELGILLIARRLAAGSTALPRVLVKRQGVPFGAGIAAGAVIASFWFPNWLWLT